MKRYLVTILLLVVSLFFILLNSGNFFFWDNVIQISIPANWYYDHNFRFLFLPDEIATGHPTFVSMYIALIWKLFGRSLIVSHLSMLPFVFGILFQLNRYIEKSETDWLTHFLIFSFVVTDATLVSQMSLVSFDITQIFFFLWCINSIVYNKRFNLAIAFTGLILTSLRGTLCSFGIILFSLLYNYIFVKKIKFSSLISFLPGLSAFLTFLLSFYITKHWIIHNTVSNKWQQSGEFASFTEILRNIGLFGWRLIDYGRIVTWIVFFFILFKVFINNKLRDSFFVNTFFIALCQFLVFFPVVIIYKNFIGHRYLLPIIIPVSVCTGYYVLKYFRFPKLLYAILFSVAISGYFWIYPDSIAQGWDATPAHWPYYKVRTKMLTYLKKESIPVTDVGSFFPNLSSFKNIDLSGDTSSFKEAEPESDKYLLFSNVFNIPDEKLNILENPDKWYIMHKIKKRNIYMILLIRKDI